MLHCQPQHRYAVLPIVLTIARLLSGRIAACLFSTTVGQEHSRLFGLRWRSKHAIQAAATTSIDESQTAEDDMTLGSVR